jgi:hypothetical protein
MPKKATRSHIPEETLAVVLLAGPMCTRACNGPSGAGPLLLRATHTHTDGAHASPIAHIPHTPTATRTSPLDTRAQPVTTRQATSRAYILREGPTSNTAHNRNKCYTRQERQNHALKDYTFGWWLDDTSRCREAAVLAGRRPMELHGDCARPSVVSRSFALPPLSSGPLRAEPDLEGHRAPERACCGSSLPSGRATPELDLLSHPVHRAQMGNPAPM